MSVLSFPPLSYNCTLVFTINAQRLLVPPDQEDEDEDEEEEEEEEEESAFNKKMMRYPASPTSPSAIMVVFFLASAMVLGADSSSAECTKFSINGSITAGYSFSRHRFYDFRRIDNTLIAPDDTLPSLSNSTVSKSVNDTSWTDDWDVSVKTISGYSTDSTILLQYTADNVYIR